MSQVLSDSPKSQTAKPHFMCILFISVSDVLLHAVPQTPWKVRANWNTVPMSRHPDIAIVPVNQSRSGFVLDAERILLSRLGAKRESAINNKVLHTPTRSYCVL